MISLSLSLWLTLAAALCGPVTGVALYIITVESDATEVAPNRPADRMSETGVHKI